MRPQFFALPLAALAMLATPLSAQDMQPDGQADTQVDGAADTMTEEPMEDADGGPVVGWGANPVIVTGIREAEERVEVTTRAITRRPRVDKPIARFHTQACIGVFGMQPDYAGVIIDRMQGHARRLGIPVGGEGCQVNVLVGFVRDGEEEIRELRKAEPKLFSTLLDYEFDRILRGNGAVQAWHGTALKSSDGRAFSTGGGGSGGPEFAVNSTYSASRLRDEVRMDMTGAIVLIDSERTPGKTLQQLADYAAMRVFVAVDDMSSGGGAGIDSILTLFDDDIDPPAELTRFDRAYLEAVYRLPVTATGPQIHDATWRIYRGEESISDE